MQTHEGLLQAQAWVQVYPTQRSRDLDPEAKRRRSFIGASGQWDCNIRRKLHSHVSPHAGGQLNYILPDSIHLSWPIILVRISAVLAGTRRGYIVMSRFPIRVCPGLD